MSFNLGYLLALKTSGTGGGILKLDDVTGGDLTAQRGIGASSYGSLPLNSPNSPAMRLSYPISTKFSADGIAIIQFLYDAAAHPHTVAGPAGILATPCKYTIMALPGHNVGRASGLLLNFSNVGDFSRASPHFRTPSVPISLVQSGIDQAVAKARRLAAAINSMSRPTMAGIVII